MSSVRFSGYLILLVSLLLGGCQGRVVKPEAAGDCSRLGSLKNKAELSRAFLNTAKSVVIIDDDMYSCSCGSRTLGGDAEDRLLAGDIEARNLSGDTESRQFAGATESRQVGGDTEQRQMSGDSERRQYSGASEGRQYSGATENRQMSGASETRQHAGDSETRQYAGDSETRQYSGGKESRQYAGGTSAYQCGYTRKCEGFVFINYAGTGLRFYDGVSVKSAVNGCIQ